MPAFLPLTEDKSKLRKKKQHNLLSHNHLPITALCILLFVIYNVFTHYFLLTKKEWYHSDNYVNQKCRPLIPIEQPDPSKLSPERRHRFLQVRNAIRHAWRGYANVVSLNSSSWWTTTTSGGTIIPHDDLSPVSHTAFSWLNYGATLHDSIDTLYLANLMEEYDQAVQWLTSYDIQTTSIQPTKTFEYSLRIIGGLLGAYSLSGDPRLFATAQNAADAILEGPFKASPTIIPRPFNVLAPATTSHFWDWRATIQRTYQSLYNFGRNRFTAEHRTNSLAGFGSFGLEFAYLSIVSGDPKYRTVSDQIFRHVMRYEKDGIVPNSWNVLTGEPITIGGSLGSGSDSFYEYLLKIPLLDDCYYDDGMEMFSDSCTVTDKEQLVQYEKTIKGALRPYHTKKGSIRDNNAQRLQHIFPVEHGNRYDHLLCFLPGMLALGAETQQRGSSKQNDMSLAYDLMEGCAELYRSSPTGLSPDTGYLNPNSFEAIDPSYYLRPEYVESLFVLYRITKDENIQNLGWRVFESLEQHCKIEKGGYAGLKDVNHIPPTLVDDMPSYFLAETLKYLLLLFSPDDCISLDDFVFTTEAHPLRKMKSDEADVDLLPLCTLQSRPPVPVPWKLLFILSLILTVALGGCYIIWRIFIIFLSLGNDKSKTM